MFWNPSVDDFSFDCWREEVELQDASEVSWGDVSELAEFFLRHIWIFLESLFVDVSHGEEAHDGCHFDLIARFVVVRSLSFSQVHI